MLNSRLGLVTAAPSTLRRAGALHATRGTPSPEVTGSNLPSSLTEVPSSTLVSSTSPPVSVCGTVARTLASGFSCAPRPTPLGRGRGPASHSPLGHRAWAFPPARLPTGLDARDGRWVAARGPRLAQTDTARDGNLTTRSPSPTARALGLGPPHPQRMTVLRNPRAFGVGGSRPHRATHTGIRTPRRSTTRHQTASPATGTLPYRLDSPNSRPRGFGAGLEPRWILGAGAHRPVSYYALFQGWLLLSQPPGCLRAPTAFPTEPGLRDLSRRSGLFPSRRRIFAPAASLPRSSAARYSTFVSGW